MKLRGPFNPELTVVGAAPLSVRNVASPDDPECWVVEDAKGDNVVRHLDGVRAYFDTAQDAHLIAQFATRGAA